MATSETYAFNPSAGDIILNAFGMIQIRRWMLTTQHLVDANFQANLLMVDISNRNPNRWVMETQEIALSDGVSAYNLENRTVAVSIVSIRQTINGVSSDRVIGPLSATDYESLPNKAQLAPPTSYFFSLLTPTPTITFWPVPNADSTYTARVQTFRQLQDVSLAGGTTVDSPYRFLDAITTGLASRLAVVYPESLPYPDKAKELDAAYQSRFLLAAGQDQESTPMYVRPEMSGYYR